MDYTIKKQDYFKHNEQIQLLHSSKNDAAISHSHEFVELVYIFSGKGIHSINNKSYFISAGDLLLIRTDDYHSIYPVSEDKNELQWINCIFLPEFIEFDFSVFTSGHRFIGTFGYEMNFLFYSMIEEFNSKKIGYLEILKSYLYIILSKLSRSMNNTNVKENYVYTKKQMLVKKTLDYIELNYKNKITLPQIATELNISTPYLVSLFKGFIHKSIIEYINSYRLEKSCKLLENSSLTISEIAMESGFCDVKFYYNFFQRHMGTSPGEFRKKLHNN